MGEPAGPYSLCGGRNSPAQVIEADGQPFSTRVPLAAIQSATSKPLSIRAEVNGIQRDVDIDYLGGLRYPTSNVSRVRLTDSPSCLRRDSAGSNFDQDGKRGNPDQSELAQV